jgi:hypothetical protein
MTGDESVRPTNEQAEAGDGDHKRGRNSVADTLAFLRDILFDRSIVVRGEDRTSSWVLSIFLFVGMAAIVTAACMQDWVWLRARLGAGGFTPFRPINLVVLGAVDVLYFIPLCWFVLRRMGILRTMTKRHALICCQLMIGASILTALVCVNIAVIALLVCLGNSMHILVG